jgi:RNA ligase (TIGR02306 family)
MSSLIVPIAQVEQIRPHPNADRLEIAEILGWQVVVGKGTYQPGDSVIYVPPDAVVPAEWADRWGVAKYLSNGRVRCARLRGEPSFGFTAPIADLPGIPTVGENVADSFGITKYEPAFRTEGSAPDHALFVKYTEIENLRHFPTAFEDGEPVVLTEKIHGANVRLGLIDGELMVGSHRVRWQRPNELAASLYWSALADERVAALLTDIGSRYRQVILFGEVYGRVQRLRYGLGQQVAFRAFDLLVDGQYVDWHDFALDCAQYAVPTVPVVAEGRYALDWVKPHAEGPSLVPGADHYREGVVVKPFSERRHPAIGRLALKYVSDTYLLGGADEPTGEVDA